MAGAPFLSAAGGTASDWGYYFEVEVLSAAGDVCVGLAGTNLGPQCRRAGDDACSWGLCVGAGGSLKGHRCDRARGVGGATADGVRGA